MKPKTKTELNALLKTLGYGSMRYSSNVSYVKGPIIKRHDKILKGIKIGSSGPYSTSDYTSNTNNVIKALQENGFELNVSTHMGNHILSNDKFEISLFQDECRAYANRDMDPSYKHIFLTVTIKNKK